MLINSVAMPGPPAGHDVGQVDDLERLDRPDEHDRGRHRDDLRPDDLAEYLPRSRRRRPRAASTWSRGTFSSAASMTMKIKGIHCQLVADHNENARRPRIGRPSEVAEAEPLPDRQEGSLAGVGKHAEGIADAERRDHQRE